ncbi:hypothetical protein [Nitrospira sp. M1]
MSKIGMCFMMIVIGSSVFFSLNCHAAVLSSTTITYKNYTDIPQPLRQGIRENVFLEQFISQRLTFIRNRSQSRQYLNEADLLNQENELIDKAEKNQLSKVIKYDQDLDGEVTIEEIRTSILKQNPILENPHYADKFNKRLKKISELDLDKNGVLSYKEMNSLAPNMIKRATKKFSTLYKKYLLLDPNQDGRFTAEELELLARKAFATVDKDRDSFISSDEFQPFQKAVKFAYDLPLICKLPSVDQGVQLLSIGIRQGTGISSVTIAGQDKITTSVSVKIKEDSNPMYVVLTSSDPVIWKFSGHTEAIRHLALHNTAPKNVDHATSGVTGIPKERVSFLGSGCIPSYYGSQKGPSSRAKSAIRQMVGRVPDRIKGSYEVGNILVTSNRIDVSHTRFKPQTRDRPIPQGYHLEVYRSLFSSYPNGVIDIVPSEVVADAPVESYEILPVKAGLAKLAYDGYIAPVGSNTFRILKTIPRYPAGLQAGQSVNFLIAKGVQVPKGDPGHRCVKMEETGEVVSGRYCK